MTFFDFMHAHPCIGPVALVLLTALVGESVFFIVHGHKPRKAPKGDSQ